MLLGPKNNVWSSLADTTVCSDSKPSPPGLPSMMIGCPHFCCSTSVINRAAVSAPEPGPNGRTKRTGCVGHCCAKPAVAAIAVAASASAATIVKRNQPLSMPPPSTSDSAVRQSQQSMPQRNHRGLDHGKPDCLVQHPPQLVRIQILPLSRTLGKIEVSSLAALIALH